MGDILFILLIGFVIYDCVLSPTGFFTSKKEIMRHVRRRNKKRGITMRPGWAYCDPDGKKIMSSSGRPEDAKEI